MKQLVEAFDGRLNVLLKQGGLTVHELSKIGVARISVGPRLTVRRLSGLQERS